MRRSHSTVHDDRIWSRSSGPSACPWTSTAWTAAGPDHFLFLASKGELGEALITRYASRFADALDAFDLAGNGAPAKLEGYVNLYLDVVRNERMCLCGMLAAEYRTLPMAMRGAVVDFFDYNETWLTRVLDEGRLEGTLDFEGPTGEKARMIVAGLEGAMLVARPYGDITRFEAAASQLVQELVASAASTPGSANRLATRPRRRATCGSFSAS